MTYKYSGIEVIEYLEKDYITLTEEEEIFRKTRENLKTVVTKLLNERTLKVEMINDTLLKNLIGSFLYVSRQFESLTSPSTSTELSAKILKS